jgi:hypothetical protein
LPLLNSLMSDDFIKSSDIESYYVRRPTVKPSDIIKIMFDDHSRPSDISTGGPTVDH